MSKESVKPPVATAERPRLPDLNARIRARRSQLDLTGVELAQRAGISASYVSLIENGAKVPDEEVAAELARVLDDDEDLYRAWARASRLGPEKLDLLNRLEAASRTPAYLSLVESGQALPRLGVPDDSDELAARMREVAARLSSPSPAVEAATHGSEVVSIPVLAEGVDPARLEAEASDRALVDTLLVDRRLLDASAPGLFACDVTPRSMKFLRGVCEPGDRLVFQSRASLAPDRVCAVRGSAGLVLSRVLLNGRTLLLLPGEGETGFEAVDVPDQAALARVVVGSHVLLIRR
jgi:transcriptional regulator with XRE-family HTH domain